MAKPQHEGFWCEHDRAFWQPVVKGAWAALGDLQEELKEWKLAAFNSEPPSAMPLDRSSPRAYLNSRVRAELELVEQVKGLESRLSIAETENARLKEEIRKGRETDAQIARVIIERETVTLRTRLSTAETAAREAEARVAEMSRSIAAMRVFPCPACTDPASCMLAKGCSIRRGLERDYVNEPRNLSPMSPGYAPL